MSVAPFAQVVGKADIYLAPKSEAPPAVDTAPAGNWVLMGPLDGEHAVEHGQTIQYFMDNNHTGPVKSTRTEEAILVAFVIAEFDHADFARVLSDVANVTTGAGPPAFSQVPHKRGFDVVEYAILFYGSASSPFGNFPGYSYIPRVVLDGNPRRVRAKDGREMLEVEAHALEDDTQAAGDELGWTAAQTS